MAAATAAPVTLEHTIAMLGTLMDIQDTFIQRAMDAHERELDACQAMLAKLIEPRREGGAA